MADKKKVEKVIEKLKSKMNPNEEQLNKLKELADKYDGKSQEEMMMEIMNFRNEMIENMGEEEFEKKMKKLEMIRPMLSEEQGKKLDQLLAMFKETDDSEE